MSEEFVEIVKAEFSFLEGSGFRCVSGDPQLVHYRSENAFVTVRWDDRSGELNAIIGLLPSTGRAQDEFSLLDVLGLEGVPLSKRKPAQVTEKTRLHHFVAQLAYDLRKHARLALTGDRMYFRRLEAFRATEADAFMRGMKLRRVRSEAETAWHNREFGKVVCLYSSIADDLTDSEARKLEYAKQRQSN